MSKFISQEDANRMRIALAAIESLGENLSDGELSADATDRGLMYCTARELARIALRQLDSTPDPGAGRGQV